MHPHNNDAGQLLQKIESKAAQSSGSNHVFLEGDCSLETARRCRTAAFQAHNMPLDVCIAAADCGSRILTYPAFARVELTHFAELVAKLCTKHCSSMACMNRHTSTCTQPAADGFCVVVTVSEGDASIAVTDWPATSDACGHEPAACLDTNQHTMMQDHHQ